MAEVVPESDEQVLQHFVSNSNWDTRGVVDQVAVEADGSLGGSADSALLIDESGLTKKGKKSVWVYAALSRGSWSTQIDERLYLPKEWIDDPARCQAAKIPRADQKLKTKPELALEMVPQNRRLGIGFSWVGADGAYGSDPAFLRALEADVHKDQHIYLVDPEPALAAQTSGRIRKPRKRVAQSGPIWVDRWLESQPDSAWRRLTLCDSNKAKLRVEVLQRRVWLWDNKEAEARHWHLMVRREVKARDEITYALSNAPPEPPVHRLAQMQGQRYWIERSFQDGKSQASLDHYQVRGWKSWHLHIALVMMAMLFMLRERREQHEEHPLLSCAYIETLLAHFLPRRDVDEEEVIRQLQVRHEKRLASIDSAYANQPLD